MLTTIQKKKLILRDREAPAERAKYDYIIGNKLKNILDDLADIDVILTRLPKHKLQKVITDKHISILLRATEIMMLKMDYRKIDSIDDENLIIVQEDEDQKLQFIPPTQKDLQRAKTLYGHLYKLERFVEPDLLGRVSIPNYEKPIHFAGGMNDAAIHQLRSQFQEAKAKGAEPK